MIAHYKNPLLLFVSRNYFLRFVIKNTLFFSILMWSLLKCSFFQIYSLLKYTEINVGIGIFKNFRPFAGSNSLFIIFISLQLAKYVIKMFKNTFPIYSTQNVFFIYSYDLIFMLLFYHYAKTLPKDLVMR